MRYERLFICGNAQKPREAKLPVDANEIPLVLWGPDANITLKICDITERMVADLPPIYEDLLEIAAYVYCADQAVPRGGSGARDIGAKWRRNMYFIIPVRDYAFWRQEKVTEVLQDMLGFLSDDDYKFYFTKLKRPPSIKEHFEFSESDVNFKPDEILLFSGGLDSLAGAVQEVFIDKKRVALVSHRSAPKIAPKQKELHAEICKCCESNQEPFHVPVWIQKHGWEAKDNSQRTRSFLYASLGATIAAIFGKKRIKFYENGVTSINLPIAGQVVGARATRTTHPQAIAGFSRLFSYVSHSDFEVETPFLWKTKTDIVELIRQAGHARLIKHAVSCSHVFQMTRLHTHCGCCSQCIDRRLAVMAALNAECQEYDPAEMYKTDVFIGQHSMEKQDIVLAESYVRMMKECADLDVMPFYGRYGELSRVIPYISGQSDEVAGKVHQLFARNGRQVREAISNAVKYHADDVADEKLPDRCLLKQLFGTRVPLRRHRKSAPGRRKAEPKRKASVSNFKPWDKRDGACFIHEDGEIRFYYRDEMKKIPFRPGTLAPTVLAAFLEGTQTGKEIKKLADSKLPPYQIVRNINRTINDQLRKVGFEDISEIEFIHFSDEHSTYALFPRIVSHDNFDKAHFFEE